MWKELGEALGDLAGTGERVNMVSAALYKILDGGGGGEGVIDPGAGAWGRQEMRYCGISRDLFDREMQK